MEPSETPGAAEPPRRARGGRGAGAGPAKLRIRPAREADVGAVGAIVRRAYDVHVRRLDIRPVPLDADHAAQVRAGLVFVADRGAVVGLIVLVGRPDHLLIENVAVDPEAQGEGVGRELLAFAEREARSRGHAAVRLYTHREMRENVRMYERLGYVREPPPEGDTTPRVFFVKQLG